MGYHLKTVNFSVENMTAARKMALRYSFSIRIKYIFATSELTQSVMLVLFLNPKILEGRKDRCSIQGV